MRGEIREPKVEQRLGGGCAVGEESLESSGPSAEVGGVYLPLDNVSMYLIVEWRRGSTLGK